MDDRTRRAIGFIAAFALIGGLVLGGFALLIFPREEPVAVIPPMPPPTDEMQERARDAYDRAIIERAHDRIAEQEEIYRMLDRITEQAEALRREVDELGAQQDEQDRLADELERKLDGLDR